jgi:hypothetical protein
VSKWPHFAQPQKLQPLAIVYFLLYHLCTPNKCILCMLTMPYMLDEHGVKQNSIYAQF